MKKNLFIVTVILTIMFLINITNVVAEEPKFSCAYETSYILDFYDDEKVIFYTMSYNYPSFKFDSSFNKKRSSCPPVIYVVEDYTYTIAETQIANSKKFNLTTPQNSTSSTETAKFRFSCKIGGYNLTYYTNNKVEVTNYSYSSLAFHVSFNKNPSSCPTNLYEKKINSYAAIIADKNVSGFTLVNKTTDENAAHDNINGSDDVPNNEVVDIQYPETPTGDPSLVERPTDVEPMDICSQNGVKQVLHILGFIIFAAKLVVPLLLIIMGTIDIVSALKDPEDKTMKDSISKFVKRIIAAIIIFFIPTIINFAFSLVDNATDFKTNFKGCGECIFKPLGGGCNYTLIGDE